MRRFDLSSVEDCEIIFPHGDYVVLSGKNPWIFRKDGTYVAKLKAIRQAYNMKFLPGNMVLMDGFADRSYHYVSLDRGEVVWSCPKKGRRNYIGGKLAVSPDGNIIYYVYSKDNEADKVYVDHIEPEEQKVTTYHISPVRGAVYHGCCDNDGRLFLLRSVVIKEPGTEEEVCHKSTGILEWSPGKPEPVWKYHWWDKVYRCRAFDDRFILLDDLRAFSLETGEIIDLLENSPGMKMSPGGIDVRAYDPISKLLTVCFTYSNSTIIIDCQARKVISHYAPISRGLSGGCLIDNAFWIGTYDGVIKRPFPHMDEFPRWL